MKEEIISDNDDDENCATSENLEENKVASINSLSIKSRKKYETVYKCFMDWRGVKNVDAFTEDVVLKYFEELGEKYKSSSLWTHFSMLRSTLTINHGVNIENYAKLRAYLKSKAEGFRPKKSKIFSPDEIKSFISEAPDKLYLSTKVALIMGIMGACHANELYSMNVDDVQDLKSALLITVPNSKTKIARNFTITGSFYGICKKYTGLRPTNLPRGLNSFFLHYQNGHCTSVKIGINKFGSMGKKIATFLKLPNPHMYSAHSFRRSSNPKKNRTADAIFQSPPTFQIPQEILRDTAQLPTPTLENFASVPALIDQQGSSRHLKCAFKSNIDHTVHLFNSHFCPEAFDISEIEPLRAEGSNPCRWMIRYVYRDKHKLYQTRNGFPDRQAISTLKQLQPENATCVNAYVSEYPASFKLEYAVRCRCDFEIDDIRVKDLEDRELRESNLNLDVTEDDISFIKMEAVKYENE